MLMDHPKPNINFLYSRFIGLAGKLVKNKPFRFFIAILAIGFCISYLVKNLHDMKSVQVYINFNGLFFFFSFGIVSLIVLTGGIVWIFLIKGLHQKINILEGLGIQNFSNITKYVPGFIWPYASKIILSKENGINQNAAGFSVVLEFSLVIFMGFLVGVYYIPDNYSSKIAFINGNLNLFRSFVFGGVLLFLGVVTSLLRLIQKRLSIHFSVDSKYLLAASSLLTFNWLGLGIALWLLSKSFYSLTPASFDLFVFSFVVSVISGILFLPVPNGIGVRESVMVFLLSEQLPSSVAVMIAILSRLLITLGEVVNYFGIFILLKLLTRRKR